LCYVAFVNVYVSSALTFKDNFRVRLKFSAFMVLPISIAFQPSANALGEYWSDGFSSANPVNWVQDPSISSSYSASYVIPGVNGWNTISSKVRVNKVSSGTFQVRVAVENVGDFSTYGRMIPYCAKGTGIVLCTTAPKNTWTSAKIVGYEDAMTQSGFTATNITQIYTHEFGHALSMQHVPTGTASTMTPYGGINLGVQAYDKANLKARWGN
jgi:hypothetical protein